MFPAAALLGGFESQPTSRLPRRMQCNATQCKARQCKTMQRNATQCNAMQCSAMQCVAMQCCPPGTGPQALPPGSRVAAAAAWSPAALVTDKKSADPFGVSVSDPVFDSSFHLEYPPLLPPQQPGLASVCAGASPLGFIFSFFVTLFRRPKIKQKRHRKKDTPKSQNITQGPPEVRF